MANSSLGLELGGNGVGFANIGDANPEIGEDPVVWHGLRVVRHPGVVFGKILLESRWQ